MKIKEVPDPTQEEIFEIMKKDIILILTINGYTDDALNIKVMAEQMEKNALNSSKEIKAFDALLQCQLRLTKISDSKNLN